VQTSNSISYFAFQGDAQQPDSLFIKATTTMAGPTTLIDGVTLYPITSFPMRLFSNVLPNYRFQNHD
jgi:hypothetical protein